MDLRALTATAVRFFGLYILLGSIETAAEIGESLALPKELSGGGLIPVLAINLAVSLFAAWLLLARTRTVTGWVLRGQASGDETAAVTGRDLTLIAFALAGLIFLVSGLENIANQIFGWYFAPHRLPTGLGPQLGRMGGSLVKIVAGVWLLLRSRRNAG